MIYDATAEGLAESVNFLLDSTVLVFARKEAPSRRDPSFMKTFRLMNRFMVPGSYMRDDGRVEVAKFDWSEDVKVTNSAACVRLNVAPALRLRRGVRGQGSGFRVRVSRGGAGARRGVEYEEDGYGGGGLCGVPGGSGG
jgi:hypothetical protein